MKIRKSILALTVLLVGCMTGPSPDPDPGATLVVRPVNVQGAALAADTLYWFFTSEGSDTTLRGGFVRRADDGSRWALYDSLPAPGMLTVEAFGEWGEADGDCAWLPHGRLFVHTDTLARDIRLTLRMTMACP